MLSANIDNSLLLFPLTQRFDDIVFSPDIKRNVCNILHFLQYIFLQHTYFLLTLKIICTVLSASMQSSHTDFSASIKKSLHYTLLHFHFVLLALYFLPTLRIICTVFSVFSVFFHIGIFYSYLYICLFLYLLIILFIYLFILFMQSGFSL